MTNLFCKCFRERTDERDRRQLPRTERDYREDGEISSDDQELYSDDDDRSVNLRPHGERINQPPISSRLIKRETIGVETPQRELRRVLGDPEEHSWATRERYRRVPRYFERERDVDSDRSAYAVLNDRRMTRARNLNEFSGRDVYGRGEGTSLPLNRTPFEPRAQSTAQRPNATNTNGNFSMTTAAKMFKVEPFPKGIKTTEQFQEWTYWLSNFEMASERAGIIDQRPRAVELSLHVGEELRRVIVAKSMLPSTGNVSPGFPFYDYLVDKLEGYFRSMTDETVDVTTFNNLKQAESETAQQFELRLLSVAKRLNETNKAMIRTRFIEGLRDRDIRDRAYIDGTPMQEVVMMATRRESMSSSQGFSPWERSANETATVVAAVVKNENRNERYQSKQIRNEYGHRGRSDNFHERSERRRENEKRKADERCKRCGVVEHRNRVCPAENAECFKCKNIGHFQHMCAKRIRAVDTSDAQSYEMVRKDQT